MKHLKLYEDFEKKNVIFFFDMDGVLADFDNAIKKNWMFKKAKKDLEDKYPQYKDLPFEEVKEEVKKSENKELKQLFNKLNSSIFITANKEGFFLNLNVLPICEYMLKKAYELTGNKPNILTGSVKSFKYGEKEKREWVEKHFKNEIDNFYTADNKGDIAKEYVEKGFTPILIDDMKRNIKRFEENGGIGIYHKTFEGDTKAVGDTMEKMENVVKNL